MIYEFRTYDLKPRSVPEFEKRSAAKIKEGRRKYSELFGFWYTEAGPLNQVVHIWPYEDLNQRSEVRAKVVEDGVWPPDNTEFVNNMQSEIFLPAPFNKEHGEAKLGPVYEMRIYIYAPGDIPNVINKWGEHIEEREKFSPLVGAWYSELGDSTHGSTCGHTRATTSARRSAQRPEKRVCGLLQGASRHLHRRTSCCCP